MNRRRRRWPAVALLVAAVAGGTALYGSRAGWFDVSDAYHGPLEGAELVEYDLRTPLTGRTAHQTAVIPAGGADDRPLLLFLHGRGSEPQSVLSPQFFAALRGLRERAPVVVLADGGESSYYHDRDSGRWGTSMVREVLPDAIRRFGADGRRVAIGGISMGGFGALDLARRNPERFCAAGGHSPAIFPDAGATAPGAFDDADDFARHDLVGAATPGFAGSARVWLDAGSDDPFRAATERFAAGAGTRVRVSPGGHDGDYWDAHMGEYLRFYADALARC